MPIYYGTSFLTFCQISVLKEAFEKIIKYQTANPPSPLLGEPKFIEIGFGSHSVTIFELPKHEDRYATHNNKSTMKQDIQEMICESRIVTIQETNTNPVSSIMVVTCCIFVLILW